ncbi:MAG: hypothetical protein VCA74_00100 [Deltaproteobacteria bacterium]
MAIILTPLFCGGKPMSDHPTSKTLILFLIVATAIGLRLLNANTAFIHSDEVHYAQDLVWAASRLSAGGRVDFLRHHPRDHPRLRPDTAATSRWGERDGYPRNGHPSLQAWTLGALLAAADISDPGRVLRFGRIANALLDSTTVLLLPLLVAALGGSTAAGLGAAALYACYPPSVAYGSLLYLDPPLAPLLVTLLWLLARGKNETRSWLAIATVTALMATTKQTGLIALALVPVLAVAYGHPPRRLLAWAAAAALLICLLVDPVSYVNGMLVPNDPSASLEFKPLRTLTFNLGYLGLIPNYYWLGFAQHGKPLAWVAAYPHHVLTPVYLTLYPLALALLGLQRRWRTLLALLLPVAIALCLLPPSVGIWRLHILTPLLCATIALALARSGPGYRVGAAVLALAVASAPFVPARPGATDGNLPLDTLIFANPRAPQRHELFNPFKGRPLRVVIQPGQRISRRIWLGPGRYGLSVESSATVELDIDGHHLKFARNGRLQSTLVSLEDRLHLLTITAPAGAQLYRVSFKRRPG